MCGGKDILYYACEIICSAPSNACVGDMEDLIKPPVIPNTKIIAIIE